MNMEVQMERIEAKLDDIRDRLHSLDVLRVEQKVHQESLNIRLSAAEVEIALLKTAHDRIAGILKALSIPGLASVVWGAVRYFEK